MVGPDTRDCITRNQRSNRIGERRAPEKLGLSMVAGMFELKDKIGKVTNKRTDCDPYSKRIKSTRDR